MGYHLEDGDFDAVADLLAHATFGADIIGRAAFRGREEIRQQYERTNVTYADRGRATKEIYSNVLVDIDLESGRPGSVTSYTVAQQPRATALPSLWRAATRTNGDEWTRCGSGPIVTLRVQYRNNLDRHMHADQHPWTVTDGIPRLPRPGLRIRDYTTRR